MDLPRNSTINIIDMYYLLGRIAVLRKLRSGLLLPMQRGLSVVIVSPAKTA